MSDDYNVSERLPMSDVEARALRPVIVAWLRTIPVKWAEFDADEMTELQSNALILLIAAGMVERRGWIRTTIANHPTCFEFRFQATGEGGLAKAMKKAVAVEYQVWSEAWRAWQVGEMKDQSPFHVQDLKPQECRLTAQGEIARDELSGAVSEADVLTVVDFVLKCGLYGPGYWLRRALFKGQPLTSSDEQIIERELGAGRNIAELARPPVVGSGQLLQIRKSEQAALPQSFSLENWNEGATAFAKAFKEIIGPTFEAMKKPISAQVEAEESEQLNRQPETMPTLFQGGEMVFLPDRVVFCGAVICGGRRSETRRRILGLLRTRRGDTYAGYSSDEIAAATGIEGGADAVPGAMRDLRDAIIAALKSRNIASSRSDVIRNDRRNGYRFADCVSVQEICPPEASPITDNEAAVDVRNVRNDDVRNVPNVADDASKTRREWILRRLEKGHPLQAPAVVQHFKCSVKTAQRDLAALKEAGRIEFFGAPRTGYYRLRQPPTASQ